MKNKTSLLLFAFFAMMPVVFAQENPDIAVQDSINNARIDSLMQTYNLDEVVVSAVKPLVKVELDKIIYDTASDAASKTSTVLDMLKKVPLVTVDGNDKIALKGSSDFVVYLNGKPSGMFAQNPEEVLRNMPANAVKNIEVITDPGAKYDAEGVSGILNIVTVSQTSMDGITATINGGLDSNGGGDAGIYLMAQKGKLGFTGTLNGYRFRRPETDIDKISENFDDNSNIFEKANLNIDAPGLYGSGTLSYEIDTLNLINVAYNTRYGWQNTTWKGNISQRLGDNLIYSADRIENGNGSWGATDVSADYQHTSARNAERRTTLSYRFSYSPSDSDSESFFNPESDGVFPPSIPLNKQRQYTEASTNEHTFQADYATPFGKIHSIETGVKYILRLNKSNSDYSQFIDGWQPLYEDGDDHNALSLFNHRNDILSAYGSYALKLKKWGLRAGLRYEYTLLDVEFERDRALDFDKTYSNLIPSILGTYQINDSQSLRLGYNMRLLRPGIWQLNPYINDSNPNFIEKGNPNLDAVLLHSISLNYVYFNPKFTLNANLSQDITNKTIEQITEIGDGGTSTSTYKNIGNRRESRVFAYMSWTPKEWLKLYSNISGAYYDIRANDGTLPSQYYFRGLIYGGFDFRFPYKIWLSGWAGAVSERRTLQTIETQSWMHALTLRRDFLNDRLSVKIYANSPFSKKIRSTIATENPKFHQKQNMAIAGQEIGFVLSYRFGDLKAQLKKTAKSIVNDDVMKGGEQQGGEGGGQ
jgi:outer membrane receptor protein involved in Fe transport